MIVVCIIYQYFVCLFVYYYFIFIIFCASTNLVFPPFLRCLFLLPFFSLSNFFNFRLFSYFSSSSICCTSSSSFIFSLLPSSISISTSTFSPTSSSPFFLQPYSLSVDPSTSPDLSCPPGAAARQPAWPWATVGKRVRVSSCTTSSWSSLRPSCRWGPSAGYSSTWGECWVFVSIVVLCLLVGMRRIWSAREYTVAF